MAIEVLSRGIPLNERKYTATCNSCRSRLRFARSDGHDHFDQRDGDYVSVTCPVCGGIVNANIDGYEPPQPQ